MPDDHGDDEKKIDDNGAFLTRPYLGRKTGDQIREYWALIALGYLKSTSLKSNHDDDDDDDEDGDD